MGPLYHRCKSARNAALNVNSTDCTAGTSLGSNSTLTSNRVGSLESVDDLGLSKTFRGSRVTSNGEIVNQNMTSTFDPATLTCLVCSNPHNIIPRDGTGLVLVLGDQNFVSSIVGHSHCIPVVRIEDASLSELFQIGLEILDRNPLPQNTHFMVGSASHLSKVGTTLYAIEWQQMVRDFTRRWLHATVGPLTPILKEQSAPEVGRQITEIKRWYDTVYVGNISYQDLAWKKVISILSSPPDSGIDLPKEEIYTVALPASLTDPVLKPFKFHINSCHAATTEFGGEATDELICTLLDQLHCTFSCDAHPDDFIARVPAELEGADTVNTQKTLILLGGSHCRRLADSFHNLGYTVIDKSIPGWQPTESNIVQLHETITSLGNIKGATVVCDFVSNITYRFEQMDGQLLLPIKLGGKYHLLGKVTTINKELLVGTLRKLREVINLLPGLKVCVAPLPRYLFTACCSEPDHCVGIGTPDHPAEMLSQVAKVRKVLREHLTSVHANIHVPDLLSKMLPGCNTHESLAGALRNLSGYDGVHLTTEGYDLLAETIHHFVSTKDAVSSNVTGRAANGEKPAVFYWRGFASPVGAARPERKFAYHDNRSGGGKLSHRFGPNKRGGRSYPPGGRYWNY